MRSTWLGLVLLLGGCSAAAGGAPALTPSAMSPSTSTPATSSSASPTVTVPQPSPTRKAIVRPVASYELPYAPTNFVFDSHGGAWINSGGTIVELSAGGTPKIRFHTTAGFMVAIYMSDGDQLWQTVSGEGADKLSPTGAVLKHYPGPSSDWAPQPFTVDREGNPWVGYNFGSKIYKYSASGTRLLDLEVGAIRGLRLDSRGNVVAGGIGVVTWLGLDGKVLSRHEVGNNFMDIKLDAQDRVWTLEQDEQGTVYRLNPDGAVASFNPTASRISNLQVSRDGSVWFVEAQSRKLYRMDENGKILGSHDLGEGLSSLDYDPAGFLWAGYHRKSGAGYVGEAIKLAIE